MALTALQTTLIKNEFLAMFTIGAPQTRAVMLAAGVSGQAAKSTDVQAVLATALAILYGTAPPVIKP